MGRRGGGVLLYIKGTIPAYEVQLQEEADCNEAIWCNLVTGHTTVTIGVVYRCPNITKKNNENIHNAISIYIYNRLPVLQISMFRCSSQYLVAASGQRRPAKPSGALYHAVHDHMLH